MRVDDIMACRKICCLPNDLVLRQKARKVPKVDGSIRRLVDDMLDTMRQENGVGLAAPQIGVSLRVVVIQRLRVVPLARPSCPGVKPQ